MTTSRISLPARQRRQRTRPASAPAHPAYDLSGSSLSSLLSRVRSSAPPPRQRRRPPRL